MKPSPLARRSPASLLTIGVVALAPAATAQQTAQVFDAPVIVVPDHQQRMNALLDLNNDGWTDAVGTFYKASNKAAVFAFLNDGTGCLEPMWELEWSASGDNEKPFPIATGDLNGDDLDDFVTAARTTMTVFRSNGAAAPTVEQSFSLGWGYEAKDLELGDYDGDGVLEAAVRLGDASGTVDRGIRIYDDIFTDPTIVTTPIPFPGTGFDMRNIDGDGDDRTDLLLVGTRADIYKLNNLGLLQRFETFDPGMGPLMGASGDLDGDGDEDVALFEMGGTYCVLRRQGPTGFVMEAPQVGGPATDLADVDGDGDPDGVCCGGGGGVTTYSNLSPAKFEISINDGSGGFAPAFQLHSLGANHIAGVDDIDHDGDADLIAGRVVYYNVDGIRPVPMDPYESYVQLGALQDFDGDGDPDARLDWLRPEHNLGDGGLREARVVAPRPAPGHTWKTTGLQADFDGDGDIDLAVSELENGVFKQPRLLLNTGGGGLRDGGPMLPEGQRFRSPGTYGDTLMGDPNGDGLTDVIVGHYHPTMKTDVFLQQPNGMFTLLATLNGENVRALADVDDDGCDDLVLFTAQEVVLRYGAEDPLTSQRVTWPMTSGNFLFQSSVGVCDLDANGTLELIVPNHLPGQGLIKGVRVLKNFGNRQFEIRDQLFPDYEGFLSPLLTGDVNGDGEMDVILGQPVDPVAQDTIFGMRVYFGDPGPSLEFTNAGAETYPVLVKLDDQDGDGDLDAHTGDMRVLGNRSGPEEGGRRRQFGRGTRGLGGQAPVLGATGPFAVGEDIEIRITGAAPNAPGMLLIGESKPRTGFDKFGSGVPLLDPMMSVPFFAASSTGEWGSGAFTFHVTVPAEMAGRRLFHQVWITDPTAEGGIAISNLLELRIAD